ncbi:MAG: aminoacyl-tRNA hydrolase [Pseudomonadota bacterium]
MTVLTQLDQIWQALKWRQDALTAGSLVQLAAQYRTSALRGVTVIGVTGSCGKTMTKELIFTVLAARDQGFRSEQNSNTINQISRAMLKVRPWYDFYVQEIAIGGHVPIQGITDMVKPEIGVVTNIGSDHLSKFGSLEAIALEKAKMLSALPRQGIAVLNGDDDHVLSMQSHCHCRIVTYGLSPDATVRALDVRSVWPHRLSFTVAYDGQSAEVETQLVGEHWAHSVLAAIAVGVASDIALDTAAEAVQSIEPFEGRMFPLEHPDGATFVRDDFKAPLWTVAPALEFLRTAQAKRKILVLGTLSDYRGDSTNKYVDVANDALEIADYVFFVGPRSTSGLRAKRDPNDDRIRAYAESEALATFMKSFVQPGDLVLLKGRNRLDHLADLVDACMAAPLNPPTGTTNGVNGAKSPCARERAPEVEPQDPSQDEPRQQALAVAGIGNVGESFQETRHNVGQRVLDLLVEPMGAKWIQLDRAMVAQGQWEGETVYLIKTLTNVNHTGEALLGVVDHLRLEPTRCLLVHDETDLPVGATKKRLKGGAGGHKGISSILEAFQSTALPRLKIGIGKPESKDELKDFVLGAFSATEKPLIDSACAKAAEQILDSVALRARQKSR